MTIFNIGNDDLAWVYHGILHHLLSEQHYDYIMQCHSSATAILKSYQKVVRFCLTHTHTVTHTRTCCRLVDGTSRTRSA